MFGEGGPSDSRALVLLVFNGTLQDLTVLDCVGEHRGFGTVWESTIVLWDCEGEHKLRVGLFGTQVQTSLPG